MISMPYHLPITGLSTSPNNGSWTGYWARMPDFEKYDCFEFSSADFHNPLYARFVEQTGINIGQFESLVRAQQMTEVSMGVFQASRVVKDIQTDQLYINVPQSGRGVFFKIWEIDPT